MAEDDESAAAAAAAAVDVAAAATSVTEDQQQQAFQEVPFDQSAEAGWRLDLVIRNWDNLVRLVQGIGDRVTVLEASAHHAIRVLKSDSVAVSGAPKTCQHGIRTAIGDVCSACASPWLGNYSCDSCGGTGDGGPRYACTVCRDVDLCQKCVDNDIHSQHALTQVKHLEQKFEGMHPVADIRYQQWDAAHPQSQPQSQSQPQLQQQALPAFPAQQPAAPRPLFPPERTQPSNGAWHPPTPSRIAFSGARPPAPPVPKPAAFDPWASRQDWK